MKLERDFYLRDGVVVAKELLGKILVHHSKDGVVKGRIVEVEAYMGEVDKGSHSYKDKGKQNGRTMIQYGEGGYAYIYMIYGMYYCMNVVANTSNVPEAVLIRGIEPLYGIDLMKKRRGMDKVKNLCNGPGKLCIAFGIDKSNYGMDLCGDTLYIEESERKEDFEIVASKRINIDYAEEAKDYLYRFSIKNSKYISVPIKE